MNEHMNLEFYWEGLTAPKNGGGTELDTDSKLNRRIKKCYENVDTIK